MSGRKKTGGRVKSGGRSKTTGRVKRQTLAEKTIMKDREERHGQEATALKALQDIHDKSFWTSERAGDVDAGGWSSGGLLSTISIRKQNGQEHIHKMELQDRLNLAEIWLCGRNSPVTDASITPMSRSSEGVLTLRADIDFEWSEGRSEQSILESIREDMPIRLQGRLEHVFGNGYVKYQRQVMVTPHGARMFFIVKNKTVDDLFKDGLAEGSISYGDVKI